MSQKLNSSHSLLQGFDGEEFLKCLKHLISIEREWVPYSNKCSLYIRPTLIGTQVRLISYRKTDKTYSNPGKTCSKWPGYAFRWSISSNTVKDDRRRACKSLARDVLFQHVFTGEYFITAINSCSWVITQVLCRLIDFLIG